MSRSSLSKVVCSCLLAGCWLIMSQAAADPPGNPLGGDAKKPKIDDKI